MHKKLAAFAVIAHILVIMFPPQKVQTGFMTINTKWRLVTAEGPSEIVAPLMLAELSLIWLVVVILLHQSRASASASH
jgi:hypothetical protein